MLVRIILRIIANALLLYVVAYLVPGITYSGGMLKLLLAGFILGIVNLFIKPIVVIVSIPLIILTLGMFYFMINGFMLWIVSMFIPEFHIDGLLALILGSVLFTFMNLVVTWIMPKRKQQE